MSHSPSFLCLFLCLSFSYSPSLFLSHSLPLPLSYTLSHSPVDTSSSTTAVAVVRQRNGLAPCSDNASTNRDSEDTVAGRECMSRGHVALRAVDRNRGEVRAALLPSCLSTSSSSSSSSPTHRAKLPSRLVPIPHGNETPWDDPPLRESILGIEIYFIALLYSFPLSRPPASLFFSLSIPRSIRFRIIRGAC